MLGRTNAMSKSGGGGGGDVVQATNRTGELIHSGEKVWLETSNLKSGSGFQIYYNTNQNNANFITDNNCDYIRYSTGLYFLGNGRANLINNGYNYFPNVWKVYNYGNSCARLQETPYKINILYNGDVLIPEYTASSRDFPINTDSLNKIYIYSYNNKTMVSYDKYTKKTIMYTNTNNLNCDSIKAVIGNKIYSKGGTSVRNWIAEINENTNSFEKIKDVTITGYSDNIDTSGILSDKKIIGRHIFSDNDGVIMGDFNDNGTFTIYAPDDVKGLEEIYYPKENVHVDFYPDSQILTYVKYENGFECGAYKYIGNNEWKKLNINIPLESPEGLYQTATQFGIDLAISIDMKKAVVCYYGNSYYMLYKYVLEDYQENNIYKYSLENITENTLTGTANLDIPSGQTGEVSTVLPTYVPPKQYEVNEDATGGITFTSSPTIIQGENGNTIFKQTPDVSINLGTDAQNIYEGFGSKDNKTADEFCIRLRMFDTTFSVGNGIVMLLSDNNLFQEPRPDGTLLLGYAALQEGIDSPIVTEQSLIMRFLNNEMDYTCYTDLPEDKFVTLNEWFILKYKITYNADTSQYEYTTTILNDDGDILGTNTMTSSSGAVVDKTTAKILDYDIVGKPLFDVDLSQTGFKLNNEWVWRPVKEV